MKHIKDFTINDGISVSNETELTILADLLDNLKIYTNAGRSFRNVPRAKEFIKLYGQIIVFPRSGDIGSPKSAYKQQQDIYFLTEVDFDENLDHYSKRLIDFHKAFKSPVLKTPTIPNKERAQLRISLLQEELNELQEAIDNNDIVECGDALTDLLVVLEGTFAEFGMQKIKRKMFDEVMDSNMSKLDRFGSPIINGENGVLDTTRPLGKILKSELFFEPNLKPIIENEK